MARHDLFSKLDYISIVRVQLRRHVPRLFIRSFDLITCTTGSGLYIFFILANTVPGATTFTSVDFVLDGTPVSSFTHQPSTSTDYEYNQAVFANDSIPYGLHTMTVAPVNNSVNNVLILFDYLIYTCVPCLSTF